MQINKQHIRLIKRHIDEKLRQRSIFVETKLKLETYWNGQKTRLKLTSTKFNTVPVIHSELEIDNFGGSIVEGVREFDDGTTTKNIEVYVPVHVSYKGNGVSLFSLKCEIQESNKETVFFTAEKAQASTFDLEE